jgi:hypothetical protein
MLPEYAITLAGNGDSRLLKRSVGMLYDKYHNVSFGNDIAKESEYPLINIISTKWYYDYTNDLEFVEHTYPGFKALLERWFSSADPDGLLFLGRQFIEWTKIDKNAKLTATHSLLAEACKIMSEFAQKLNNMDDKIYFEEQHLRLKEFVKKKFWDNEKNLFNDGFKEGLLSGKYYPTSNAWPLLYECADQIQKDYIIDYLEEEFVDIGEESRNRRITPYSSLYALAALYQNERADIAERFIRQYWTRMILNGDDTAWENFDIASENNGGGQGTASHAWSGHPTYFLTTEALGVSLGYHKQFDRNQIFISPQSESLSWARGKVPHPQGTVSVEWRIEGENLHLSYEAPENIPVVVKPRGRLAKLILWVNGIKQ